MKDNGFWLGWLIARYENADDPVEILKYPELIRQVNPASVKAAANLYLNEKNFIKLLLLPEK
jgi:zinc protease